MKDSSAFLEEIGMSVSDFEGLVLDFPIHDVWEEFGDYRTIGRSARPREFGVLEVCNADEDFVRSVLLPFDQHGALQRQCRVILSNRERELVCRKIDAATSGEIHAEVECEILASLPDLRWELVLGDSLCTGDHIHSVRRENSLLRICPKTYNSVASKAGRPNRFIGPSLLSGIPSFPYGVPGAKSRNVEKDPEQN